jgi:hypothetical protein
MAARYITNNGHATATATATFEHGEAKRVNYRSDNGRGGYFDFWAACRRAFFGRYNGCASTLQQLSTLMIDMKDLSDSTL